MKALTVTLLALLVSGTSPAEEPYFQQRVNYNIRADLDPQTARIAGSETITYFNNSPDTLREIYFHLYYNAFHPGSYLDRQLQHRGDYRLSFMPSRFIGFIAIDLVRHDGIEIDSREIDNTIMRVPLAKPLIPGDSTFLYIEFTSQVPSEGNRAARRGRHFDVGQWYPKPAVYDRFGWHTNQYLSSGEFFSEFGDYDIELTLPSDYIVAHTGALTNETEIFGGRLPLPDGDSIIVDAMRYIVKDTLLAQAVDTLMISDTAQSAADSIPSPFIEQDNSSLKTWRMKAVNVHDFAFCADPDFLIDICRYDDITIKVLYPKSGAARWSRRVADITRKAIRFFSDRYYPYPSGQFTTVQSTVYSGMEYPEMVMVSGSYGQNRFARDLETTVAHEIGHNWFYGILGFNESEEGFLDEGLTTFATTEFLEHYYGRFENSFGYDKPWQKKFLPSGDYRNESQLYYLRKAQSGTEDPMATPANLFRDDWSYYNSSYYKSGSVFFMLQYTLGREKFDLFLKTLFERWAFRHPYFSDIQDIASEIYGGDLRWFFRQWFTTDWTLDYSLASFKTVKAAPGSETPFEAGVRIENLGRCISPLDLVMYGRNGRADTLYVPVDVWSDGQASFDTTIALNFKPERAVINPDLRLADINRLNNSTGLPPIRWQFMVPKFLYSDSRPSYYAGYYSISHNPTLWYNDLDGARIGYRLFGSYLDALHNLDVSLAIGLQSKKVDYGARLYDVWESFDPRVSYFADSREWEGRGRQEIGLRFDSYDIEAPQTTQASLQLSRHYLFNGDYLFRNGWSDGETRTIDLGLGRQLTQRYSMVLFQGAVSASIPGSDYRFSRLESGLAVFVPGLFAGRTRFIFKGGVAEGQVPFQRRFYLSSDDPYDTWDSPLYRSRGTLPDKLKRDGHLFKPGGAWLAGYYDRYISGEKILSGKVSADLPPISLPFEIPLVSRLLNDILGEVYFAGGHAWDGDAQVDFDSFLWESGLAFDYKIPFLERVIPENRLSLYLPLWLSDTPPGQDNLDWRWIISLTR